MDFGKYLRRPKMGGYGSGRYGGKKKVQHCRSLDVNKMNKAGGLKSGYSGQWQWSEDGEKVASIECSSRKTNIVLKYRWRAYGEGWESSEQSVPVTWTPCHYGGQRPFFQCPGIVNGHYCGRRVIKLYSGGKYFLCRHCYNLTYNSQSETRHDRLLRRANKRRIALGGEPGIYSWIEKPKGMWQRTYSRHKAEILAAEQQATSEFMRVFSGRLSKEEMEMYFE